MKGSIIQTTKKIVTAAIVCLCVVLFIPAFATTVHADEEKKDYQIKVNRAANCVTVYEKDIYGEYSIPVRAFVCSCGREGHETPLGTFKTSNYYKWRMMVDGTYGKYAVRFNNKILFHSLPYTKMSPSSMKWDQYNLLGQGASLGCVRLACADAKWIYDNCKKGTQVIVYDDAANPGPLGKPEEVKIAAENPYRQWDPTDEDFSNPWRQLEPSLYLTNDVSKGVLYLPVGAQYEDLMSAVGLKNAQGVPYGRYQYKLTMYGNYDLNKPGVYKASIVAIGLLGIRTEQEMTLCVV